MYFPVTKTSHPACSSSDETSQELSTEWGFTKHPPHHANSLPAQQLRGRTHRPLTDTKPLGNSSYHFRAPFLKTKTTGAHRVLPRVILLVSFPFACPRAEETLFSA